MKKTIALFAITLLFLSVGVVLADQNYPTATNVQLDTMSRQSADSVCGPVSLAMVEKDKVRFRLNNILYDVPRPESLQKDVFTTIGDCAVQAVLVKPTQYSTSVVLAFMPISENKIYFGGDVLKLRVGEEQEILRTKIKCTGALNDRLKTEINGKSYTSRFGETVKQGAIEVKSMNRLGVFKGTPYCVLQVKAQLSSLLDTPETIAAKGTSGGAFAANLISGKVTYSPEEQARLEAKLTESTQDTLDDNARQLELDKVSGKFGGDVTGKVAYQVDTTKRGKADASNAKRLLSPTIKQKATTVNPTAGKFTNVAGKVVYQPEKVVAVSQKKLQANPKPKSVTTLGATGYKVDTQNAEKTTLAKKATSITAAKPTTKLVQPKVGGAFKGISGKAVDEVEPAVEKGFFAKLLSSIFGI